MNFPIRNVFLVIFCQSLALTSMTLATTVTGVAGNMMVGQAGFVTLPLAVNAIGTALAMMPVAQAMQKYGRRPVMLFGSLTGVISGLLAAQAFHAGSFLLLCFALFGVGIAMASSAFNRFLIAEITPQASRSRVISWVLASGLIASFAGPETGKIALKYFPELGFASPYLALAGLWLIQLMAICSFKNLPVKKQDEKNNSARPMRLIITDWGFFMALIAGVVASLIMGAMMISTPMAMTHSGLHFDSAATVLQWHYMAMFLPAFFTGDLIRKYGSRKIIATGGVLCFISVASAFGAQYGNFLVALFLVGVGWNFMNTGSVTLAITRYSPEEKGKAEGFYGTTMSVTSAIAAISSGYLQQNYGWHAVLIMSFVMIAALSLAYILIDKKHGSREFDVDAG
ncbi:MFS transporter [Erwinia piriflorinigrans]|nr:MFS transporter [Erwinia piriflorinigrans]